MFIQNSAAELHCSMHKMLSMPAFPLHINLQLPKKRGPGVTVGERKFLRTAEKTIIIDILLLLYYSSLWDKSVKNISQRTTSFFCVAMIVVPSSADMVQLNHQLISLDFLGLLGT